MLENREVKSRLIDSIHLFGSEIIPDFFGMEENKSGGALLHPHTNRSGKSRAPSEHMFGVDHKIPHRFKKPLKVREDRRFQFMSK